MLAGSIPATRTNFMKYKVYAVAYDKRNRIVAKAENSYVKSHPLQARYGKEADKSYKIYLHAEIAAIIRAKGKEIHKLKITCFDIKGRIKPSKPCDVCMLAINEAKIKVLEYNL